MEVALIDIGTSKVWSKEREGKGRLLLSDSSIWIVNGSVARAKILQQRKISL